MCRQGLERLREELQRVAEHYVPPPLDLKVPLNVLVDRLDCATGVRNHLFDYQVLVVAAHVVEIHWHVINDYALPVAKVVRGANVVIGHVFVVVHLAPVSMLTIERTVGVAADAAVGRFKVADALCVRQVGHRLVRLLILDALSLPLDQLVKKLPERVFIINRQNLRFISTTFAERITADAAQHMCF